MQINKFLKKHPELTNVTSELITEIKLVLELYDKDLNVNSVKLIGNFEEIQNDLNSINFKINLKNKRVFYLKKFRF